MAIDIVALIENAGKAIEKVSITDNDHDLGVEEWIDVNPGLALSVLSAEEANALIEVAQRLPKDGANWRAFETLCPIASVNGHKLDMLAVGVVDWDGAQFKLQTFMIRTSLIGTTIIRKGPQITGSLKVRYHKGPVPVDLPNTGDMHLWANAMPHAQGQLHVAVSVQFYGKWRNNKYLVAQLE
ncbi:hypothetical protein ONZ45_g12818 [Pleurotus djamor]|nr:hypothetical protein ONZ45_g12817 [Pleurotus djamor]KAJ8495567.1 hypothetical protein ONZ45_g12818 [Pleurotus djamor]